MKNKIVFVTSLVGVSVIFVSAGFFSGYYFASVDARKFPDREVDDSVATITSCTRKINFNPSYSLNSLDSSKMSPLENLFLVDGTIVEVLEPKIDTSKKLHSFLVENRDNPNIQTKINQMGALEYVYDSNAIDYLGLTVTDEIYSKLPEVIECKKEGVL